MRLGRHQRWLGVSSRHDQEIGMLAEIKRIVLRRIAELDAAEALEQNAIENPVTP